MEFVWIVIAWIAAAGTWWRFLPFLKRTKLIQYTSEKQPLVSVVVPARNEEKNIPHLLNSLRKLHYLKTEIIVVDDASSDNTVAIASHYPVKIISTDTPSGWMGKSWACQVGAELASGKYLLFTDADTIHYPNSIDHAIAFIERTGAKFISAPAYHCNLLWWQKLLGPFYCMVNAGASPYDKVSKENPYALGQYLLIEKDFYTKIGGHNSIKDSLADDASLAQTVIANGGTFYMYNGPPLCSVQMYNSFSDFCQGWLRIFRLGMYKLKPALILNVLFPLLALNLPSLLTFSLAGWMPLIIVMLCFTLAQRKFGNCAFAGILLFPLPILMFVILATTAFLSQIFKRPLTWRGRKYILTRNAVST